jgi:hypothetical protein
VKVFVNTPEGETMTKKGKPDFLGLGAQKAATSWIHACLLEHPQVFVPPDKEIHFFSRLYAKGPAWYERHFRGSRPDQVVGEISPTYLYDLDAPRRIHEWNPEAKLVACLRNPVDRAFSAYRYAVKMGQVPPERSFADMLEEKSSYIRHSLYHPQVERYLAYFPMERMLFVVYEDIAGDPVAFMQGIYRFLGVDGEYRPSAATRKVNDGMGAPRFKAVDRGARALAGALRGAGFGNAVWKLARSPLVEGLNRLNRRPEPQSRLPESQRSELERFFVADVLALERLLHRNLSARWLKQPPVSPPVDSRSAATHGSNPVGSRSE